MILPVTISKERLNLKFLADYFLNLSDFKPEFNLCSYAHTYFIKSNRSPLRLQLQVLQERMYLTE